MKIFLTICDIVFGFALGVSSIFPTIWFLRYVWAHFLNGVFGLAELPSRWAAAGMILLSFLLCRIAMGSEREYSPGKICGAVSDWLLMLGCLFVEAWILNAFL